MWFLFDQGVPALLRRYLAERTVSTAYEQGWSTLRNGELLTAAELAGFEVFVTTDKNLRYQQNITGRRLAIVILATTSWPIIERHAEYIVPERKLSQSRRCGCWGSFRNRSLVPS